MSSTSAYGDRVRRRTEKINAERLERFGSKPEVVAYRIVKIVNTKRPRDRHAVGGGGLTE